MNKNKGFTLIEVIVSIAVIGLIISALFNINLAGWKFFNYNQDRVDLMSEGRLISTNLERKIRSSNGIDTDASNSNKLVFSNGDQFYVNSQKLFFESNGNTRSITTDVINSYNFDIVDDLVKFNFVLVKDDSTYEINNKFYPRAN